MTTPFEYFEGMYERSEDPWGFSERWYEQRKRAVTLASLPERHYGRVFEPGCSIGVLSEALADRCDSLLATDISEVALARAAQRLAGRANVKLEPMTFPAQWPDGTFDLVVLSEILYYFGDDDLDEIVVRAVGSVAPGGNLLAVHWRHFVAEYPQQGDAVQRSIETAAAGEMTQTVRHVEDDFDLAVFVRPGPGEPPHRQSVACRTGLC